MLIWFPLIGAHAVSFVSIVGCLEVQAVDQVVLVFVLDEALGEEAEDAIQGDNGASDVGQDVPATVLLGMDLEGFGVERDRHLEQQVAVAKVGLYVSFILHAA